MSKIQYKIKQIRRKLKTIKMKSNLIQIWHHHRNQNKPKKKYANKKKSKKLVINLLAS